MCDKQISCYKCKINKSCQNYNNWKAKGHSSHQICESGTLEPEKIYEMTTKSFPKYVCVT